MTAKKAAKTADATTADAPVVADDVKPAAKARAPAKQKVKPAVVEATPDAQNDAPVAIVDHHSPRYETVPAPKGHKIVEDPDSHVRYCSKCQTPEHMTEGDDCVPRAA